MPIGRRNANNIPYIAIRFFDLPLNMGIGTLFIDTAVSFEPVASMRGIFPTRPRGSY